MPKWIDGQTLAFLRRQRRARDRRVLRFADEMSEVVSLSLAREERTLAFERPIQAFDINPGGDQLAVILLTAGPTGDVEQRLYVLPTEGREGMAVEVVRASSGDQLAHPRFRP
jgi:hypothetical protein